MNASTPSLHLSDNSNKWTGSTISFTMSGILDNIACELTEQSAALRCLWLSISTVDVYRCHPTSQAVFPIDDTVAIKEPCIGFLWNIQRTLYSNTGGNKTATRQ